MDAPNQAVLPALDARSAASFARQTMMTTLGATMTYAAGGLCTLSAPIGSNVLQQHGAAHAGLAFMLGDSAAGYAALMLMPAGVDVMTVEMKINLLSPAVGDTLEAVGEVVRAGKRLTVVKADVFAISAGKRKCVAVLQGTMIPVDPT